MVVYFASQVKKMNPTRLKELLKERDESLQGSKKDLITRLLAWEKANQAWGNPSRINLYVNGNTASRAWRKPAEYFTWSGNAAYRAWGTPSRILSWAEKNPTKLEETPSMISCIWVTFSSFIPEHGNCGYAWRTISLRLLFLEVYFYIFAPCRALCDGGGPLYVFRRHYVLSYCSARSYKRGYIGNCIVLAVERYLLQGQCS